MVTLTLLSRSGFCIREQRQRRVGLEQDGQVGRLELESATAIVRVLGEFDFWKCRGLKIEQNTGLFRVGNRIHAMANL